MRRRTRLVTLTGCLILVLTVGHIPCVGQEAVNGLLEQEIELHLTNGTLLQAISKLTVEKRIPIGFEPIVPERFEHRLNIAVNNAKLKDILDMIVRQEPDYRWVVRDGVINLTPAQSRDQFIEELLNTPVHCFAPAKGLGEFAIIDAIMDLPEVRDLLKARGITALRQGFFYRPSIYTDKEVSLSITNTNVRGVLNMIIRKSEYKMWRIGRSGKNREFLEMGI